MSKSKDIYSELTEQLKAIDYKSDFGLRDMVAVENYKSENTVTVTVDGEPAKICKVGELDIAIFGLGLGLIEIGGEKVEAENLESILLEKCGSPLLIKMLYYDMFGNALKKK